MVSSELQFMPIPVVAARPRRISFFAGSLGAAVVAGFRGTVSTAVTVADSRDGIVGAIDIFREKPRWGAGTCITGERWGPAFNCIGGLMQPFCNGCKLWDSRFNIRIQIFSS
jgi:hypothetical protein